MQDGNNLRVNPRRKDFGPAVAIPWLWWGLRWTTPDERNRAEIQNCAFIDNLHHLQPHRDSLNRHAKQMLRAQKATLEVAASIAELASFGLVGTLKSLYELGGLYAEERRAQQEESLSIEQRGALAIEQQIEVIYDFFHGLLSSRQADQSVLPAILVLDDAQWIDPLSLQLVKRLFGAAQAGQWPLLIIATHWEQEWNLAAETGDTLPGLFQTFAKQAQYACQIKDIDRLAGLQQLLDMAFPGLSKAQRQFLCDRADGNPRLLNEIILELRDEPLYFEDEDFKQPLTEEALSELKQISFALHEVQKRRFRRLDRSLQQLLSYGSFQGMRFLRQLVLDMSRLIDAQADGASLQQAVYPLAILVEESAIIYEFRHQVFHDLAQARLDKLPRLKTALAEALLQAGQAWLKADKDADLPATDAETLYRLLLHHALVADEMDSRFVLLLLSKLLGLYQTMGMPAKAEPWLPILDEYLPQDGCLSLESVGFWSQIGLLGLLMTANRWHLAENIATGLLEQCLARLADEGESAERLRDVMVCYYKLFAVLAITNDSECITMLRQALAINERRIATCPHYARQAASEQSVLVEQFVAFADESGDETLRAEGSEWRARLETLQSQYGFSSA